MKNVLVIGSTGQIGSELTMKLRSIYGGNIVAGYIPGAEPKGELLESGPSAIVDITNEQQIAETVSKYNIDTIYNLAALLSAVAEAKPQLAWKIGMGACSMCLRWPVRCTAPYLRRALLAFSVTIPRKTRLLKIRSVILVRCTA